MYAPSFRFVVPETTTDCPWRRGSRVNSTNVRLFGSIAGFCSAMQAVFRGTSTQELTVIGASVPSPLQRTVISSPFLSELKSWPIARITYVCLLYTSDAADDLLCVDLGGRR